METILPNEDSNQLGMERDFRHMIEQTIVENIEIIRLMKLQFVDCSYEQKRLTTKIHVEDWELNPQGSMHGGLIATVFDTTFGLLTHFYAKEHFITTVDLSTRYLKPVPKGSNLLLKVHAVHVGQTLVSLTGEAIVEDSGVLAAVSNATFMIVRGKAAQVKPPSA